MHVRNSDRPVNPISHAVAGRFLFVRSNNSQLGKLLEQLFAGWQLTPVTLNPQQAHVVISCHVNEEPPFIPLGIEQFEIAEQAQCYIDEEGFFVDFGNSLLQLKSTTPVDIQVWFKSEPDTFGPNLARTLSFAVCAGLRRHGVFELHSAGLLAPDCESGVVLIGPSGSGKSTLTTQLALSGWKYLSDDELLLTLEDDLVIARGFRRFFALSTDAVSSTGVAIAATPPGNVKACFEPVDVFSQMRSETATPRVLFFTRIGGKGETQVAELSRTETMTRLLRASPWATYDREIAAENLKVLTHLARQSTGFELFAGSDLLRPGHAAAVLKSFIKS